MSPENQAENTTPSTEKTAKANPPKPSKPKSSVIQIHPEGERIHPKKAEGRFAKLRIAAVLATQFVFYVIPWFNWSNRQAVLFNIPDRHFVLVDDDCRSFVVRLFLPANGLHRNHALDRQLG